MELVVTTGAIRKAKQNHHHRQAKTKPQLFTGQMPFLLPKQQCQSTEGEKVSHSMGLLTPSSLGGLPTFSLTTKGPPGYLGRGLSSLSSAPDTSNNINFLIEIQS